MIILASAICQDFYHALDREWLVANGIGGYASGTVAGANSRRYHGLLVAALAPPLGRTVLLAKVEEEVQIGAQVYLLSSNEYDDGTIFPQGHQHLQAFRLEDGLPVFTYHLPGAALTKRVWMDYGENTTHIQYTLAPGSAAVVLKVTPAVTYRDYHHETTDTPEWDVEVGQAPNGCLVQAYPWAAPCWLVMPGAPVLEQTGWWYWRVLHRRERERGLDAQDHLYTPVQFAVRLDPGESVTLTATTNHRRAIAPDAADSLEREQARRRNLVAANPAAAHDEFVAALTLAADAFVVARPLPDTSETAPTIMAGYHWFGDWGRDTMIALPGLLLSTGRAAEARRLLLAYARYVDQGMLPNTFPEPGREPEYNTVDAPLWYFEAVARYLAATGDTDLLEDLVPTLEDILRWYTEGTRYGIGVDAADGLLRAGDAEVQLTWMDAKVDGRVMTSRHGKAVEINALWYNALRLMENWSRTVEGGGADWGSQAARVQESFHHRFWYAAGGYLYDVVDQDGADDSALRPNQIVALSLTHPVLAEERWPGVLAAVERALVTPLGVRTLDPADPRYQGRYDGDRVQRDAAYHQGTVWPWLLGPVVDAWLRVRGDRAGARALLGAFPGHLTEAGLGTISEIADGDAPHTPRGCIAQAWSVGEVLRAWLATAPIGPDDSTGPSQ